MSEETIINQAEKGIAETGVLSLPCRRKLWEAMEVLEPRDQDSGMLRSLTDNDLFQEEFF